MRHGRRLEDGIEIVVHVQPGARREGLVGEHGDAWKIALRAKPKDGEANAALVRWIAERLDVPRSAVTIAAGASARRKRLRIAGDPATLAARWARLVRG